MCVLYRGGFIQSRYNSVGDLRMCVHSHSGRCGGLVRKGKLGGGPVHNTFTVVQSETGRVKVTGEEGGQTPRLQSILSTTSKTTTTVGC